MNKKRLFFTIGISGLAFAVNYFISFFLTSFVTENIGVDAYGFVSLSKTFASYAVIATTALNSYASRYIALEYHKNKIKQANVYFNSVFFSNLFSGLLLIILSCLFVGAMPSVLSVPVNLITDVRLLFLLVFVNLCISLAGTAFQASAIIKNKIIQVSIFKGISYIIEAIVLLTIYSILPAKIFFVAVGMIFATLFLNVAYLFISKKYTSELKVSFSDFSVSAVKELIVNGIWNSFNSLGNTLNSGLDLLVSNTLLSAIAMGQVSIVKTIVSIFSNLYQMVCQPFEPIFLKDYANADKENLIYHLKTAMKISGLISNLAFAGVVGYGLNYYYLWVPNQNCELLYKLTIIAIATSIFEGAVYPLYYIYTLTVKNKIPCIITIIGGLINVVSMYYLIKYTSLSIYAVFITTAIVMLFINGVTNPIYMAYCLDLSWNTFYPDLIKHVLSCGVLSILFIISERLFTPNVWIKFIFFGIFTAGVGTILHFIIVFGPIKFIQTIKHISTRRK